MTAYKKQQTIALAICFLSALWSALAHYGGIENSYFYWPVLILFSTVGVVNLLPLRQSPVQVMITIGCFVGIVALAALGRQKDAIILTVGFILYLLIMTLLFIFDKVKECNNRKTEF